MSLAARTRAQAAQMRVVAARYVVEARQALARGDGEEMLRLIEAETELLRAAADLLEMLAVDSDAFETAPSPTRPALRVVTSDDGPDAA